MFQPSFLALSRIFIILVGMIKAGYSLMIFQHWYIETNHFYQYLATFFAGSTLTLSFYKGVSRNYILLFAEFLYILMMIIIPFSSNDFRIYGFLLSGGFCFLLYPIYANENLLKSNQRNCTVVTWIFMGLGAIYYFWLTYHYQPQYTFKTTIDSILNPLLITDDITPYIFGSFSVLNVLLILLQKGKETIFFYRLKQDSEKIVELSGYLYNNTYIRKIEQEFNIQDIESANSLLTSQSYNENELNKKEKQKLLVLMFTIAFLIGSEYPLNGLISSVFYFFLIIQDQNDYFNLKVNFGYCFSYQFIILAAVFLGTYLIHKKRKVVLFINLIIALIVRFVFLGYSYKNELTDFDFTVLNWFSIINLVFCYGGLGTMIFTQPFLVLKVHEILLYFMFFWMGNVAYYVFAKNSYYDDDSLRYSSQILPIITTFMVIVPLAYLKHF
ncbi:hypothetical protein ABPG72_009696 [Tetrahymena utriculariae]